MAPKPKVLLLGTIDHPSALEAYKSLSSHATLITTSATTPQAFLSECHSGALNGVRVIYRTFESVSITGRITGDILSALSSIGVKAICHNGAGYDQVDVHACTKAGIFVSHVPTAVDNSTADTALFLLLGSLRGFNAPLFALRDGKWRGSELPPLGHDPEGKVLGILGMGGIGKNFKRKAEALGMKVVYHNRRKLSKEDADGAQYVGFEELLRGSDVISCNLPLNNSTRHILSTEQFKMMKDSVVIVNTARGAVIDEAALVKALDSGKVWSAGLDVFEEEPKIHPGLVNNPKVTLLPHMGTWTVETQTNMELWNIDNVRSMLETGKLKSRVPEQKDMPYE